VYPRTTRPEWSGPAPINIVQVWEHCEIVGLNMWGTRVKEDLFRKEGEHRGEMEQHTTSASSNPNCIWL